MANVPNKDNYTILTFHVKKIFKKSIFKIIVPDYLNYKYSYSHYKNFYELQGYRILKIEIEHVKGSEWNVRFYWIVLSFNEKEW